MPSKYRIVAASVPEGAGTGSGTPERVGRTSLIQIRGSNFFNMQSVDDLNALQGRAPGWHRSTIEALKAAGKIREEEREDRSGPISVRAARKLVQFKRGSIVFDEKHDCKGTITKANVGVSGSGKPIHEVTDRKGNSWKVKEKYLKLML